MKKILPTPVMATYLGKFAGRVIIFVCVFALYLTDKDGLYALAMQPVWKGVTPLHLLWLAFMLMMLRHLVFPRKFTMALRKAEESEYIENPDYDRLALYEYVHDMNIRAWMVMLAWLSFNALWGLLYLLGVLDNADLLMLTVFYFLCDYLCILFYCPFQSLIMKNRCCVNCRIYDWGHFMMFTPMLFIQNFFSWSLFFTSCVVLIHWELIYARYPERFWSGSNRRLNCPGCRDRICALKQANKAAGGKRA